MPTPRAGYKNKAGVPIPGCTTVLSSLAGAPPDALMYWAVKCEREGSDWKAQRQRAADTGTWIHDALEHYPDPLPPRPAWMSEDEWKKAELAFSEYAAWDSAIQPVIVAHEVQLVSEEHQAGGTFDAIFRMRDGSLCIADHKTGKTVDLPKVAAQLALYAAAALETGTVREPIRKGLVLHYTSKGLKPIELDARQLEVGLELFKVARRAYRLFKEFPR